MSDLNEVTSSAQLRYQAKLAQEEKELQELLKKHNGVAEEPEEETQEEPEEEQTETRVVEAEEVAPVKEEASNEDLSDEEKTFKKRYGDIRTLLQRKEAEWKEKEQGYITQIEKAKKAAIELPKTQTDVQEWVKKYPEAASVIEAIAAQKAQENDAQLDARLKEIEKMEAKARKQRAEAELIAIHPDFVSIREDDAFHDWAEKQPKLVQQALYGKDSTVEEVAYVITSYKNAKGIKTKGTSVSEEKAAASAVKARKTAKPEADETAKYIRASEVAKMSIREYEKRQDEIMEAMRTGKYIYDDK